MRVLGLSFLVGVWCVVASLIQISHANYSIKILALFSGSNKELGVGHEIGRQVLKLAVNKARAQYSELADIKLDIHYDPSECDANNTIPIYLAELFYQHQNENSNSAEADELDRALGGRKIRNLDLVPTKRVDAILGPSCDYLVDLVARMAAYWEIPVYSITSMSAKFANKDTYSTLTRLSPSSEHLSIFILQIMAEFRWRHMAILADIHHPESSIILMNMKRTISRLRYVIPVDSQTFHLSEHSIVPLKSSNSTSPFCTPEVRETLEKASKIARVILLLLGARGSALRTFLLCASELKMSNGEYTFVALDLGLRMYESSSTGADMDHSRESQSFDWYSAEDEANNLNAKQMFESFMVVSVDLPLGDDYKLFVEQAVELVNQAHPDMKFGRSNFGALTLALHDSLLVACEAYLRSIKEQVVSNRRLLNPMWNETYNSGLIPNLNINSNGDQELSYVLSDFEPDLGTMRPVAIYQRDRRKLKLLPDSYIHWPKRTNQLTATEANRNEPPPDEPECGFDGLAERCIDRQSIQAAMMTVAALAILLLGASGFSIRQYRRIKYEMRLDDYWWKISWADLQFVTSADSLVSQSAQALARSILSGEHSSKMSSELKSTRPKKETTSTGSKPAQSRSSQVPRIVTSDSLGEQKELDDKRSTHSSIQELTQTRVFSAKSKLSSVVRESKLAMYKHELVIVKQLNADNLEVSRELLVDLKSMRDHVHDNLARFVGLCLESGRLSIVYEFCSRGSLQEMLLNGNVAMDWTLKYSIIGDLISGLNFIHSTQLDFHGRLKSNNLVIDSRFTLKITDFGLQNLYNQLEASKGEADSESDSDGEDASSIGGESVTAESVISKRSGKHQQPDLLSLSVSQRAANTGRHRGSSSSGIESRRGRVKNRRATRYFWTAPEHLREKNVHFVGSKQGDVYSLGIILYELITRREPYFYGTNAQPHAEAVEVERALTGQHTSASSKLQPPGSAARSRHSTVESRSGSAKRLGSAISRHVQRGAGRVGPTADADAGSMISGSEIIHPPGSQAAVRRPSATSSAVGSKLSYKKAKRIDAEEILDQLRMGIQPEPVRPHIPDWVLADVNLRLLDLMRACWSEAPNTRPTLSQVRQNLKRITRGMATRNYLDNLLERLQNYATDLERIVDSKTSAITEEKQRTEGLLYQLVPKFVAEKLKRAESIEPQLHDCVTVFFSDIVGFEKYSTMMSPAQLVDLLNCVYMSFESIINSFDVTKVETIIDQFLIASGVSFGTAISSLTPAPNPAQAGGGDAPPDAGAKQTEETKQTWNKFKIKAMTVRSKSTSVDQPATGAPTDEAPAPNQPDMVRYKRASAEQIARMALCLRDMVKSAHFRQQLLQSAPCIANAFNIRMGIHSGKVCTGLVGVHRPKFCLIGDTVNVASRMHTNSKANRIQISESTKMLLESVPGLSIEPRGKIEVKGKGEMDTFWLEEAY